MGLGANRVRQDMGDAKLGIARILRDCVRGVRRASKNVAMATLFISDLAATAYGRPAPQRAVARQAIRLRGRSHSAAMTTLFISDLHLDAERPHITELFGRFVDAEARKADALYILGDLFEAWVGDDDPSETGAFVAANSAGCATPASRFISCTEIATSCSAMRMQNPRV